MNLSETMGALEELGSERTKRTLTRHGAREPFFGVKIGDMKKLIKRTGKDHDLALQLFETGNSDAMHYATIIVDTERITKTTLRKWVRNSYWYLLSEYAVAQTAAESKHGWSLGLEWIESKKENISCSGWSTLSNIISFRPNQTLDISEIERLIPRVEKTIHQGMNREKHAMCGFITCVGCYIESLHERALDAGRKIGHVAIERATPGCSIPEIVADIENVKAKGRLGKKRKRARC